MTWTVLLIFILIYFIYIHKNCQGFQLFCFVHESKWNYSPVDRLREYFSIYKKFMDNKKEKFNEKKLQQWNTTFKRRWLGDELDGVRRSKNDYSKMAARLPQIIIVYVSRRRPSPVFLSAFYAYTRAFSRSINAFVLGCTKKTFRILRYGHVTEIAYTNLSTCSKRAFDRLITNFFEQINRISVGSQRSFNRVPIYREEVNIPFPFLFIFRFIRIISNSFNEDKNSLFVGFFFFFFFCEDKGLLNGFA